jgi:HlyD family secretion protein
MKRWYALAGALLLAACHPVSDGDAIVVAVHAGPVEFSVEGSGDLRATKSTPLMVPGQQWTPRQVIWMLPDGSAVSKGDLVARFSAEQSKQDLQQALIDLDRNALARANKQDELDGKSGQIGVDLAQVGGQLAIAHRYAHATLEALARNDILDAVQDENYLRVRQGILQWREAQSAGRGKAELAVLDAQRSTYDTLAKQKKADLDALELRSPYDGVVVLDRDWSDQVPHVGASLWGGNSFASIPDLAALEVQLDVPQIEAQGIQVGEEIELHPLGMPEQTVHSRLSWVAGAAQSRSRENPVKYLSVKASVPADVARRHGWKPGQSFVGKIVLLSGSHILSVPNIALRNGDSVEIVSGGKTTQKVLKLGVRGATRTQVLDGLREGDRIVLTDKAAKEAS